MNPKKRYNGSLWENQLWSDPFRCSGNDCVPSCCGRRAAGGVAVAVLPPMPHLIAVVFLFIVLCDVKVCVSVTAPGRCHASRQT